MEIQLGTPVKKHITIGKHEQLIVYEGENILCSLCRVLGHTFHYCTTRAQAQVAIETDKPENEGGDIQHPTPSGERAYQEQTQQERTNGK